jgi:hypothetical protein
VGLTFDARQPGMNAAASASAARMAAAAAMVTGSVAVTPNNWDWMSLPRAANAVSPGFFSTLGIRILAGRDFDARDARPAGEAEHRSVIVNKAFVKRYLAGRDPLGIHIGEGSGPNAKPEL